MTILAAVYLRVSLDATGQQLAVSRQREDCQKLASERGWTVVEEYVDNSVSASKATVKRPAYDRMVEDYRAGRFFAVVCWDLDRLTRQPRQLEDWIDASQERGLLLVTANGEADLSTDGGRLFARIKASVARAEIERKGARQKAAAAQRAEHGRVPRGVRLTGYTVTGKVRESEAKVVAEMFADFNGGASLREIAARLTAAGVPTRGRGIWSPSSVRTMLVNPRYAGRAVYCGRETGQAGQWQPIVDGGTFDAVQAKLQDPRRVTNRVGTDRRHLGSGLFECGVCGGPVRSHSRRYRCPVGGHITRMGESIDDFVLRLVRARLARPNLADLLAPQNDERAAAATAEIESLRARLAKVESDYDDDLIDGRRYAVKTEKLTALLHDAEGRRARLTSSAALVSIAETDDPVAAFDVAPLGVQRSVLSSLATVRLLPAERGHKFDPRTVQILWRTGE